MKVPDEMRIRYESLRFNCFESAEQTKSSVRMIDRFKDVIKLEYIGVCLQPYNIGTNAG